jgi:hypothetical protein
MPTAAVGMAPKPLQTKWNCTSRPSSVLVLSFSFPDFFPPVFSPLAYPQIFPALLRKIGLTFATMDLR